MLCSGPESRWASVSGVGMAVGSSVGSMLEQGKLFGLYLFFTCLQEQCILSASLGGGGFMAVDSSDVLSTVRWLGFGFCISSKTKHKAIQCYLGEWQLHPVWYSGYTLLLVVQVRS